LSWVNFAEDDNECNVEAGTNFDFVGVLQFRLPTTNCVTNSSDILARRYIRLPIIKQREIRKAFQAFLVKYEVGFTARVVNRD
jgi:hypothetical protein